MLRLHASKPLRKVIRVMEPKINCRSLWPDRGLHRQHLLVTVILRKGLSYWTFTDIFEEPGPRWEAFHRGFGLMNYQDIKKSAYYASQFLNRLGATELKSNDRSSWICTDNDGGVQALV